MIWPKLTTGYRKPNNILSNPSNLLVVTVLERNFFTMCPGDDPELVTVTLNC